MIRTRFEEFGFPLVIDQNVIPNDDSTLFVCSGMQQVRNNFYNPTKEKYGSLQSCIRTNDLELVGDGTHLTYFEMLGNFSFGGNDYETSVEMWDSILKDLKIKVDNVHIHPTRLDHIELWKKRGYEVLEDKECEWSDGEIGGQCCEIYSRNLEIGNLVNPLGHSTDVGFGWERMVMILENKERVDQTSLFNQSLNNIVKDHSRTLEVLWKNGIEPGYKGRHYISRRLLRKIIPYLDGTEKFLFDDWLKTEKELKEKRLVVARKNWRRHQEKPSDFWWNTFGVFPEEIKGDNDSQTKN